MFHAIEPHAQLRSRVWVEGDMNRTHCPVLLTTFAIALTLPACGGNEEPTEDDYNDIASSTAALMSREPAGEAEAADDAMVAVTGDVPNLMSRDGLRVLIGRRGDVEYHFDVTCTDA